MASTEVRLKLLIHRTRQKVLFAEAGKGFLDFLFSLLSLPVGTVVTLLTKQDMVGSLGKLYESIENLNETNIQSNQNKDFLLKPKAAFSATEVSLLMPTSDGDHESMTPKLYMCVNRCKYNVTVNKNNVCPHCSFSMIYEVSYVDRKVATEATFSSEGGFLKDVVTYMVMDDLVVQPMSVLSAITLLDKFNVKGVGALEERVVHLGMAEAVKLLKASLQWKTVLTSVFVKN